MLNESLLHGVLVKKELKDLLNGVPKIMFVFEVWDDSVSGKEERVSETTFKNLGEARVHAREIIERDESKGGLIWKHSYNLPGI